MRVANPNVRRLGTPPLAADEPLPCSGRGTPNGSGLPPERRGAALARAAAFGGAWSAAGSLHATGAGLAAARVGAFG
jgi:hypothetical protein